MGDGMRAVVGAVARLTTARARALGNEVLLAGANAGLVEVTRNVHPTVSAVVLRFCGCACVSMELPLSMRQRQHHDVPKTSREPGRATGGVVRLMDGVYVCPPN